MLCLLLVAAGCGNRAPTPTESTAPAANTTPVTAARAPDAQDSRCGGVTSSHRETLAKGVAADIASGGIGGRYDGQTTDHYDDGRFEVLLSLQINEEPWLPDARDRAFHAFGDHCVRVVSSTENEVTLDVALQPDKEYEPRRCHMSCCKTHERAPDGTEECCFCSDRP